MPHLTVLIACKGDARAACASARQLSRLAALAQPGDAFLLVFLLPGAHSLRMPQDDALLSALSARLRASSGLQLLAPQRVWCDAERCYVPDEAGVIAQLSAIVNDGRFLSSPQTASFSPETFHNAFDAVVVLPQNCLCTPDAPRRLAETLDSEECVCGVVLPHRSFPDTALERLQTQGFSLSPLSGGVRDAPRCYSPAGLRAAALGHMPPVSVQDCRFVRANAPTPAALFADARKDAVRLFSAPPETTDAPSDSLARLDMALPVLRAVFFALGAFTGSEPLFLLALFLPELPVLRHVAHWPHALARLSLMPAHAAAVLSGWFAVRFAKSPGLRVVLPLRLANARLCQLSGAALLALALSGTHALAPALFVSLLWLGAPFVFFALVSPSRERILLRPKELDALRRQTEDALDPGGFASASPAVRMLCVCAASMLGHSQPEDAAGQIQRIFSADPPPPSCALETACALCAAQFFREQSPTQKQLAHLLDSWAMADFHEERTLLSLLLACALCHAAQPGHLALMRGVSSRTTADALFLPLSFAGDLDETAEALVLDKPHTYLRRADKGSPGDAVRFLCLASASLGRPFERLLSASPVVSPVWPALSLL